MLELIRRCNYCRSDMTNISPMSYRENPWCQSCLHERLEKAGKENRDKTWVLQGHYIVLKD